MTVVRHQLFPQKPPGSSLCSSRTGVQPSPGSSTIELPSTFAESGAYPPDRALPGSPQQWSLPLAYRHTPRRAPNWVSEEARTWERHPQPTIPPPRLNRQAESEGSQLAASLEGEPGPTPAGKTLPHSYPETRFRRERARDVRMYVWSHTMDQPGKVANPARGQLNRENKHFPACVRA